MNRKLTICFTLLLSLHQILLAQDELCDDFTNWDSYSFDSGDTIGATQNNEFDIIAGENAHGDVNGWISGIGGGSGLIHFEMSGEDQIASFTINYFSLEVMGFYLNGSSDFIALGTLPSTISGVDVSLEVLENNQPTQALLTFEGVIDQVSLMTLESSIESLCVISNGEDDPVNINEIKQPSSLKVFPNPASDHVKLVSEKAMLNAKVFNSTGQLMESLLLFEQQEKLLPFDSSYAKGLYFINVVFADGSQENLRVFKR